ncbi:MAG TPA: HAMP domain-containing sensor histidine kinase [Novosphingobium sp.]
MLRRLARSTVVRLVAAIFLLQVVSGGAAIVLLRAKMQQQIVADRTRQIFDVRDDLLDAFYEGGYDQVAREVAERRGTVSDPLILVGLSGHGRQVLSHVAAMPKVRPGDHLTPFKVYHTAQDAPVDALLLRVDLADGSHLVVGSFTTLAGRFDLIFAEALVLVVVLTALLALAGALLIGYVVGQRAHAIAATAEALASGDFAARVPAHERGDGFDHLRRQMNFMAERIDGLVSELQSVAGALAHDLKSPVARLRAAIETASAEVSDAAATEALQLALSDADALEAMLATALELTRLESGAVIDRRQRLDLAEVAADLAELYEPLAEQNGVELATQFVSVPVQGDRELVSRALSNLIDNALKYGGRHIVVRTRDERDHAVLEVEDDGPGIAVEDRGRAIGRFTRLDNARTRPGAGLGLAMVAAVARLHRGRFELGSGREGSSGGLVARLQFPRLG